ncbi:hypothetical protein JO972_10175 [Verrucomicrobiaceae bacterium 5K15]|uniref:ABC-three component systems C-terminal domain-containing protein n=1 Tax=Oceaniferula flava TaxID=2800421 RepID=A0AAE2SEZ1_9BACT|nr:ABC-three component system protein [Oceaniferula flavus]MBK1855325.1 hypothetical protein [Oceaniferula flavus]MBM1136631.1 hypothetical protein [Oceaniferula flavus]
MDEEDFKELAPNPQVGLYTAEHVVSGIPIPKTKRIELFSPDQWEEFTEEWATSLTGSYHKIKRFAGAGDQGLDVVGFIKSGEFDDGWVNYQCKYYDHSLYPTDVWVEIGKIIYYSFEGEYPPPLKYFFTAPKQVGTTLGKMLAKPKKLKEQLMKNWEQHCEKKITDTATIVLEGDFLQYLNDFDFSIFESITLVEMIKGHATTPFHSVRFGGGLGPRPKPEIPAENTVSTDHRYVRQLLSVYAEAMGVESKPISLEILERNERYKKNFHRQRERFYHAESLRNFSRDTVPVGTYEQLQEDIYQGVVDVCEGNHISGIVCMTNTVSQAAQVAVHSSPLASVTRVTDKQGICHQLCDDERLTWIDDNE